MRLELKEIKGGVLVQEYSCMLSEFPELVDLTAADGCKFNEPLIFQLRLQQVGTMVEVDGSLSVVMTIKCGKCLEHFVKLLTETFAFTFVSGLHDKETAEEVELEADQLGLIVYSDDILQLQEPLQEQLLMAIPVNPVCSVSCRGLCPECGVDLNKERCNCVGKPFGKFSALSGLKF